MISNFQHNTQNSSEIVKHLRTVHFTLFIACLVILGTSTIDNPDDIYTHINPKRITPTSMIKSLQDLISRPFGQILPVKRAETGLKKNKDFLLGFLNHVGYRTVPVNHDYRVQDSRSS